MMKSDDESTRQYAQERMNELKGLSVSDKYVIRVDEGKVGTAGDKNLLPERSCR
ncbi:MAG: hypothetical protein HC859_14740 [Bacteroidia bacterium]|nr:hypothetical protein [Bacteroidia bacterium]